MADEIVSQNFSVNPDSQEKPVSGDDITPSQGQQALPERLPQNLIEWVAPAKQPVNIKTACKCRRLSGEGGSSLHGGQKYPN